MMFPLSQCRLETGDQIEERRFVRQFEFAHPWVDKNGIAWIGLFHFLPINRTVDLVELEYILNVGR